MKQRLTKKLLVAFIIAMMILTSFGGILVFGQEEQATVITIIHTNDIHGRVDEGPFDGMGFGKLATLIRELREGNPNNLLLDAGDAVHGLPIATMVEGESMIRIMNAIGYDAMVAGNHDFNYGQERLLELDEMATFPILAANVYKEDGSRLLQSHIIKEVAGMKIAIFGLATPETLFKSHPRGVVGLTFADPVLEAQKMVELLKDEADLIIALGHLGMDEESVYTSIKIAENVEGIHLFVDGHSHHVLKEGLMVGDTLIVSAGEYGKFLGVVDITIKDGVVVDRKARLISKEDAAETPLDEAVMEVINQIKAEQQTVLSQVVGKTTVRLVGEREVVRRGESNLGNLLTDVLLEVTGADIAFSNGGGIRSSIEEGEITMGDIIRVFPFGNLIETLRVRGSLVKEILEFGTNAYPEAKGGFPHVAGMTFSIDLNLPVGNRVVDIMINGQPLDLEKEYILATNDFLAAGGDGYAMLVTAPRVNQLMAMDEALAAYIEARGIISPMVEGRITVIPVVEEAEVEEAEVEEAEVEEAEEVIEEVAAIRIHVVRRGENLWNIARKYYGKGIEFGRIFEANRNILRRPELIFPGMELIIP